MAPSLVSILREWYEFFSILGAAAATLVGAMFIVASIGSGLFKTTKASETGGTRAFVTATVVHVSIVLIGSALLMVPSLTWNSLAAILGAGGLLALFFSCRIATQVLKRKKLDTDDKLGYGVLPPLAYTLVVIAAGLLYRHLGAGLDVLAASFGLLLVIGLRNAWDMTIFIVRGDWERQ